MKKIKNTLEGIGSTLLLLGTTVRYFPALPRQWKRTMDQCYFLGNQTLPIVAILSFFIGSVLALQTGYAVTNLGVNEFLGSIVGFSVARELGPVMTAILLAGRVGSAYTAELATMKVYQEVDALITMRIPPEKMLVLPRLVAVFVMMPMLTISAILIAWFGGAVVSTYVSYIGIGGDIYWRNLTEFLQFSDVWDGIIKAQIFGVVVVLVCCSIGLRTSGGPREIGRSVTNAVVSSLILILILDYFITKLLLDY